MTVTNEFGLPVALSMLFPEEVLVTLYVCGMYMSHSAYDINALSVVRHSQCMSFLGGGSGLSVHPIPVCSVSGDVKGSVSVSFFLSDLPEITADLTGKIEGQVGNLTLNYTGGYKKEIGHRPQAQGPNPRNGLLANLNDIYEAVRMVGSRGTNASLPPVIGVVQPKRSSVILSLSPKITLDGFDLKEKSGSPDLSLTAGTGNAAITLSVGGKADLLDLLLARVPGIASRLREARESLSNPQNALDMELECSLTLTAAGTLKFGWQQTGELIIGNEDGWERDLKKLNNTYQADAKISGILKVVARIGVDTWIFEGSVGAEGSVSTAWHFGGRIIENRDGTQRTETLNFFEGLVLEGKFYATSGNRGANSKSHGEDSFERTSSSGVEARQFERKFRSVFWAPSDGTPETSWKEI